MNRLEALHILGLGEDAAPEDIKTAYRECVQILHPDKFAANKKLQDRATEQFKNLQEAYELLTAEGKTRRRSTSSQSRARSASACDSSYGDAASGTAANGSACTGSAGAAYAHSDAPHGRREAEARLAGIAAARAQLVAQRDVLEDERRNGAVMAAFGALVAFFTVRRPYGLLGLAAAVSSAACVWGIVQVISSSKDIATLNDHLKKLNTEKKKLTAELEEME